MQRRIILSFFLAVAVVRLSVAQAPQSISYQAVARNDQGHALVNQAVRFRFSLLQGSSGGAAVYVETHTVTTNEFGLANLSIGAGTVSAGNFSTIDWGAANYWLKVELDPEGGTIYSEMGTSQLLSVPYALYAKTAGVDGSETKINAGTNVTVTGSGTEAAPYVINSTAPSTTYTRGLNSSLGGYVVYVTPDGKHGLVAAMQDQGTGLYYGQAQDAVNNPANHDTNGQNFFDWRVPTQFELGYLYTYRVQISLTNFSYWCSNIYHNGSGSVIAVIISSDGNFYGGLLSTGTYSVRAVRSF
jgi:hypothetical protein